MINKVRDIVLSQCKEFYWKPHIESVVKYGKLLAKQLSADEEIIEVAAWLHDIRKIQGIKKDHHIHGSEEAVKILNGLGYDKENIEKVRKCILTHSSDPNYPPESIEAQILISADAIAHFDKFADMVFISYKFNKPEDASNYLLNKCERSFDKMIPEAKEIVKDRYEIIKLVLCDI